VNLQDGCGWKCTLAGKDGSARELNKDERTRGNKGKTYKERLRRALGDYAVIAREQSTAEVARGEKNTR
jgi:hypothetical protein